MGNTYARIKPDVAEPRPLRSREARVLQYTSPPDALRTRTHVLVGCGTSPAGLGGVAAVGGFVIDERGDVEDDFTYWPEGYYLTVSIDTLFLPNGDHAEHYWLRQLLSIAHERGYRVIGDYYSDAILESPLFAYEGRDMMMKLYLPVDIKAAHRSNPA